MIKPDLYFHNLVCEIEHQFSPDHRKHNLIYCSGEFPFRDTKFIDEILGRNLVSINDNDPLFIGPWRIAKFPRIKLKFYDLNSPHKSELNIPIPEILSDVFFRDPHLIQLLIDKIPEIISNTFQKEAHLLDPLEILNLISIHPSFIVDTPDPHELWIEPIPEIEEDTEEGYLFDPRRRLTVSIYRSSRNG